jgi:hypothetical protein
MWGKHGRVELVVKLTRSVYLCDELQIVDVVLLCDNEFMCVALPLPLHGAQHVQQVEVSAPWI